MRITKTELRLATAHGNEFMQGQKLLQEGAVKIFQQNEALVRGAVRDYTEYKVSVQQTYSGQLSANCSCYSYRMPCAHIVALLLAVVEEEEKKTPLGAVNPSWENYLKELPAPSRETVMVQAQSYHLIFVLQVLAETWTLRPMRVYIKKSGEFGQRTKLRMSYSTPFAAPEATPAETKALNHLLQRNKVEERRAFYSYYAYDSLEQFDFRFGDEIGYMLDLLVDSKLYLETGEALTRVRVAAGMGKLKFHLDGPFAEGEPPREHFRFYPEIQMHDTATPLREGFTLLAARPFWFLQENKIVRVESSLPAAYVLPFTRPGYQLRVPNEHVGAFLNGLGEHFKHDFALTLPPSFNFQVARVLTGRRLYLQEQDGALRVELKFVYDTALEVSGMGAHTMTVSNEDKPNELWRVERDHGAEAEAHLALLDAGLQLEASGESYTTNGEAVAWVFDELPKLAAGGFEVFGEEKLKQHRVNRAAPNVKLAVSSGIDWFDMNLEIDFDGVMLSLVELKSALRHQNSYLKLADGSLARMPEEWEKRFRHFFNFSQERNGRQQVASAHALLIDTLFDTVSEKRYDEEFRVRLEKLNNFKGIAEVPVPKNFLGTLRPYQQFGLNWMGFLREYGFNGCLADDMGLGKTVQALACLLHEKEKQNGAATNGRAVTKKKRGGTKTQTVLRTSLIVAPLSVVFNWEKECNRFAPDLKLLTHHGLERKRGADHFAEYDLVLTTYATMRNDIETFKDYQFNYIILDESQNIKNPVSQTAKAAYILQSRHRLVLTGTPVENNTLELWSQFAFLNPGMLGSLNSFRALFALPIEKYGDEESATLLRKMITPFLLRRTKEEVAPELPEKNEQVFYCPMPPSQKKLYEQVRDQCRAEIMNLISTSGMNDARFRVLQGLTRLRQISCHPALIPDGKGHESGKFDALMELLREIVAGGHKVLVFSQFVSMLKIIANALKQESIFFEVLTGATRNREECVRRFQEDPSVKAFLISLKAGGLGLNLTAADYVILYDPWWNPAAERQAIDRAHRIGQDKNVFVYKMISQGSVEEKILELQKKKETLVSQLISTDAGVFKHLTAEDIRGLFS